MKWFKEHNQWQTNIYIPREGDIIFFDWDGDACKKIEYNLIDSRISGCDVPAY